MDKIIIVEKLAALADRIERVEALVPVRYEDFENDRDVNELVELNFCKAVQYCVDIAMHAIAQVGNERPDGMADAFDSLRRMGAISDSTANTLKGAVRIRNIATHTYAKLDLRILHSACSRHAGAFRSFAKQIERYAGITDKPPQGPQR